MYVVKKGNTYLQKVSGRESSGILWTNDITYASKFHMEMSAYKLILSLNLKGLEVKEFGGEV